MKTYALVEDEPPARARLKRLVQELAPEATCLFEAADGLEAMACLRARKPDLLFLDIEFPPEGAFGLLRKAMDEGLALPPIAFVTAFDRYAVEAFRWAACDYLMKPVAREHLQETLARVQPPSLDPSPLLSALEAVQGNRAPERFTVLVKGRLRVLAWADVTHLRTENRLLFVHTGEGRFVLDRTLDELETLLAPRFQRTHRSALVALEAVKELEVEAGGFGELALKDGSRIPVSRDRMAEVRRRLGKG
ncbi:MAG TPA: LytTR family DNA-binding domain-containing protein [Holophagaceae bacterium]|nr:LytTR family DNA-binding domain-containing protein [Holophagaceae bacterium]